MFSVTTRLMAPHSAGVRKQVGRTRLSAAVTRLTLSTVVLGVLLASPVAQGGWEPAVQLAGPGDWLYPRVAVSGNFVHVVWRNSGADTLQYRRSTDNGATWQPVVTVLQSVVHDPCIAASGSYVNIVWRGYGGTIRFMRSSDNGASFGSPVTLWSTGSAYQPADAAAVGGFVYVIWHVNWPQYDLYFTRSFDGVNFDTPIKLTDNTTEEKYAQIAASYTDFYNVYVTWTERDPNDPNPLDYARFIRSTNGGGTWPTPPVLLWSDTITALDSVAIAAYSTNVYVNRDEDAQGPGQRMSMDAGSSFGSTTWLGNGATLHKVDATPAYPSYGCSVYERGVGVGDLYVSTGPGTETLIGSGSDPDIGANANGDMHVVCGGVSYYRYLAPAAGGVCCLPAYLMCYDGFDEATCVAAGGTWMPGVASCPPSGSCLCGEINDCNGNCAPASWVGDGYCDDGAYEWHGNLIDFACAAFSCDNGDCDPATHPDCAAPPSDCNGNGVPDESDIANGTSQDCQPDGIPDECQLTGGFTLQIDDGTSEHSWGLTAGGELCWIDHMYSASPGYVASIATTFGSPSYPGFSGVSPGQSFRVYVWSDPDQDGDPGDAVFLGQASSTVEADSIDTDVVQVVVLADPIQVSGSFFIGASVVTTSGYPAPADDDGQSQIDQGFLAFNSVPFDPENMTANLYPMSALDYPTTVFILRAAGGADNDCNGNLVPDECDIASGTSQDANGDGIPDECALAGACCDDYTGLCVDNVAEGDCLPPLRFTVDTLCQDLSPTCGIRGACCDAGLNCAFTGFESECDAINGRFFPGETCPEWVCPADCEHRIDLWDCYGDGWNGNTLDVLVNGVTVLSQITLDDGTGPLSFYFMAATGDTIQTIYYPIGGWPYEPYYYIYDGQGFLLGQDGIQGTDCYVQATGITVGGQCPVLLPTGACCYGGWPPQCVVTSEIACVTYYAGSWKGEGSNCSDAFPPGGDGVADACQVLGCCLPDGSCYDASPTDCMNADGNPIQAPCPPRSVCPHLGDLNCDGVVDFGDINPFVLFLSNYDTWLETYEDCPPENGDINGDGLYPDFGDINPFVALLTGS
jgi:hypothetical protein